MQKAIEAVVYGFLLATLVRVPVKVEGKPGYGFCEYPHA